MTHADQGGASRRDFLHAAAGTLAAGTLVGNAFAAGDDKIKVGIIGCGGRGSGAAEDVLRAAKGVEIIALGDYFPEKAKGLRDELVNKVVKKEEVKAQGNTVNIPDAQCHGGIDAYQKVIDTPGVNYVILATAPGFRPIHLEAAINAGKNVFTEKPVAVDGPGIRKCFDLVDVATKKGLGVGAGTQRHHQLGYVETMKRIHGGEIGDIVAARCYWNNANHIWFRGRKPGMTDLDYQINNWYHFLWTCGDHICEQHVHNIDVINWATGKLPIRAVGMGGRVMKCGDPNVDGHIYNFFAVDFEYKDGMHTQSTCRQLKGGDSNISEALVGTKGTCLPHAYSINGKRVLSREDDRRAVNPYVQEHTDLIASIRASKPYNELKGVTESTLCAILGRTAAYTGRVVSYDEVLNSKDSTMPDNLTRDMSLTVGPVPVPGERKNA